MTTSVQSISVFFLSILLLCSYGKISAQSPVMKDALLWQNIYIEKKIFKRTTIHNNEQSRFDQNITHFNYVYTDIGITYKAAKWLHVSVDYVPILKNQDEYFSKRHQFYISGTYIYKWRQFSFHNRTMVQGQYNDIHSSATGKTANWFYRNKTTIKYSYYDFEPYVACEIFYHFANPQGNIFTRTRSFVGVTYTLDQRSSIELYYAIERNFNSGKPMNRYITGIGYNIIL